MDLSFLEKSDVDIQTGMGYTGGKDRYVSALQRYYKAYPGNREKMVNYYRDADYENYMITVHAIKSNTKMIGALPLSERFEKLELAAREKDIPYIESNHEPVLAAYDRLVEALKPVGEAEEVHAADEIDAATARETADRLLEALDDFDDDLSAELVKKLSGYPFRLTQRDRLKEATGYIADFMYEEAAERIREIYDTIE